MAIGEAIKKYRKEKSLTQKELGDILGISQQLIGQYETGVRKPKLETIRRIAEAMEISMNLLLDGNWNEYTKDDYSEDLEHGRTQYAAPDTREGKLNGLYRQLNETGQGKALEQMEMLTKIPEYRNDKK